MPVMSVRQVYHHGHAQTHTHTHTKTHPPIHTLTTPTTPTTHNTHNTRNTHTQHTTQRARAPAGWPAGRPPTHPLADKKINIQRLLISQSHSLIRVGFFAVALLLRCCCFCVAFALLLLLLCCCFAFALLLRCFCFAFALLWLCFASTLSWTLNFRPTVPSALPDSG